MTTRHRGMAVLISLLLAACGARVELGDLGGIDGGGTGSGGSGGTGGGTTGTTGTGGDPTGTGGATTGTGGGTTGTGGDPTGTGGATTGTGGGTTGSGGSTTGSGGTGPGGAGGAGGGMGPCASGSRWIEGSAPSALMNPGRACMDSGCHTSTSKTPFTIAGTMYPLNGLHDDNDCNGIDTTMVAAALSIRDDSGLELFPRLQVNTAGNFYTAKPLPPSFYVTVISQGREAKMMSPVTNGNCNACHTPEGSMGAMGRLMPQPPVP